MRCSSSADCQSTTRGASRSTSHIWLAGLAGLMTGAMAHAGIIHTLALAPPERSSAQPGATLTSFTYHGRLQRDGSPVHGPTELVFRLFDAPVGGTPIGPTLVANPDVISGEFAVELDFQVDLAQAAPRWIEVSVRPLGSTEPFVTLSPRHPIGNRAAQTPKGLRADPMGNVTAGAVRNSAAQATHSDVTPQSAGRPRDTAAVKAQPRDEELLANARLDPLNAGGPGPDGIPPGGQGGPDQGWQLNGTRLYYNAGAVGIGTATPGTYGGRLEILATGFRTGVTAFTNGIASVHGIVGAGSPGSGVLGETRSGHSGSVGVRGKSTTPLGFAGYFEGGRNYFQRNVGIGALNPTAMLHTVGSLRFQDLSQNNAHDRVLTTDTGGNVAWRAFPTGGSGGVQSVAGSDGLYHSGSTNVTLGINNGGVTEAKLANGSVSSGKIQSGAVTSDKIANGTVNNSKISDVAWSKLTGVPGAFPPWSGGSSHAHFGGNLSVGTSEQLRRLHIGVNSQNDGLWLTDYSNDLRKGGLLSPPGADRGIQVLGHTYVFLTAYGSGFTTAIQAVDPRDGRWFGIKALDYTYPSEAKLKSDIRYLTQAELRQKLSDVMSLRPAEYHFTVRPEFEDGPPRRVVGLIADEVPDTMRGPDGDGISSYAFLVTLAAAVRELKLEHDAENAALRQHVTALEHRIADLEGLVQRLVQRNDTGGVQ